MEVIIFSVPPYFGFSAAGAVVAEVVVVFTVVVEVVGTVAVVVFVVVAAVVCVCVGVVVTGVDFPHDTRTMENTMIELNASHRILLLTFYSLFIQFVSRFKPDGVTSLF